MTDYTKLVKALRDTEIYCLSCPQHIETPDDILCKWGGAERCLFTDAAAAIEALQAQLPKRGKWIQVNDVSYKCSVCGEISCCRGNFCPDCGAKMEVLDG